MSDDPAYTSCHLTITCGARKLEMAILIPTKDLFLTPAEFGELYGLPAFTEIRTRLQEGVVPQK